MEDPLPATSRRLCVAEQRDTAGGEGLHTNLPLWLERFKHHLDLSRSEPLITQWPEVYAWFSVLCTFRKWIFNHFQDKINKPFPKYLHLPLTAFSKKKGTEIQWCETKMTSCSALQKDSHLAPITCLIWSRSTFTVCFVTLRPLSIKPV